MTEQITTDIRFSILPDWVITADISDRAVRVYAVLAGFADSETLTAFPSRGLIAKRVRTSVKSVDRALRELLEIGAIESEKRVKDGVYQSSLYTIKRGGVGTPMSPGRDTGDARVGTPVTHRTITNELEPLNYINTAFDEFWSKYPKKADKRAAFKAFRSALKRAKIEDIMAGAEKYAGDPNRELRYTKNPATWLNADAWENEALPAKVVDTKPAAEGPGKGAWIKKLHEEGEHFACGDDCPDRWEV